jgi:Uma2 family endonuclease
MSPPPAPSHGRKQYRIGALLEKHLQEGFVITECPMCTSDGIKAADVAWLASDRAEEADSATPLITAAEICVEIISPGNSTGAIEDKRALYFGSGAKEVWICDEQGRLQFYCKTLPLTAARSLLCPNFPSLIS